MQPTNHSVDTPCIPTSYSKLLASELNLQERSLGELVKGTGLSGASLTSDSTLISARQQIQIIRNCLRLSGDTGLGLRLGKRLTSPVHGALGFLANSSPDLLTAVNGFQQYLPTRMNFISIDVSLGEQWLECRITIDFEAELAVYRSIIEAVNLSLLSTVEFILGRPLHEGQLLVTYGAPSYAELYPQYFPCQVSYGADASLLLIPVDLSYSPNASADHENYDLALRQCQQMLAQLPLDQKTLRYQVQAFMLTHPPGQFTEDDVAASLFITKRTLARRLEKEGSGFRQLRDEIMSGLASNYLRDTALSVEAIAELLGYHDSANFRRAFKRWLKVTPSQYRHHLSINTHDNLNCGDPSDTGNNGG